MKTKIILRALRKSEFGLTITELVKQTKLKRSSVRTYLAYLEGAEKIFFKKIGMAKVYRIKNEQ